MSTRPPVMTYIRCPCCGRWVYIGKFNTYSIWDELEKGFDIPFEADYRVGGGRGKGWKSKVRKKKMAASMKDAYAAFLQKLKGAQKNV
jgi:hypothetical protein